jgi:hypothetical protein
MRCRRHALPDLPEPAIAVGLPSQRGPRIDDRRDCPARHRLHRGAQPRCIVSAGGLGAAPVTARGRASPAGSVLVCGRLPKALRRPGSPGLASPAITMWLGDAGATMTVDGVMIYTVNDDGRITSIRGHWEPDRAMATLTGP